MKLWFQWRKNNLSKGGLPKWKKEKVFKLSGGKCAVCNYPLHYPKASEFKYSCRMVVHHIKYKSNGGTDALDNLEARCKLCEREYHNNQKKQKSQYPLKNHPLST